MKNNMSTWSKWQIAVGGWCLGIGVINLTMGWLRDEE